MKRYNFLLSKASIVAFLCINVVFAWLIPNLVYQPFSTPLPLFLKVKTSCDLSAEQHKKTFIAYVPNQALADDLLPVLCTNEVLKKQYGKVEVHWGFNLSDTMNFVGKGSADLVLTKEHIMQTFMAELTYNYQPIIGYSDYAAYFISLLEKPRISKDYFLDKKIGLVDYPTSRSGHILPKARFKQLDLDSQKLHIVYASSHSALRELLANGEVDIIASYWEDNDSKRFSSNYITPINKKISGSRWYYKMTSQNTDLHCALQKALIAFSSQQLAPYYKNAERFGVCNDL